MKNTKISIILCTYNRQHLIGKAIENIQEQTFKDYELIIINDGSTDLTHDIINKYLIDDRIKYYKLPKNIGLAKARNLGISESNSKLLAFQDDDCIWNKEKLEKLYNVINNSDVGVVYSGAWFNTDNEHKYIPDADIIKNFSGNIYNDLLADYFIGMVQSLIKYDCFKQVGKFDVDLSAGIDWDMYIRISKYYHFEFINEPLLDIYFDSNTTYFNSNKWLYGRKQILNKHFFDFYRYDSDLLSEKYYNLGISMCIDKNKWLFNDGKKCLEQAFILKPKIKHFVFYSLTLFGKFFYSNNKLINTYKKFNQLILSIFDLIRYLPLKLNGFRIWLSSKYYRNLKNHERFWTRYFDKKNKISEFKNWVENNKQSRKVVSNFVKQNNIKKILDVGCGIALDYKQYLDDNLDIEYYGIDLTSEFIKIAKREYPKTIMSLANSETIPYKNNSFDMVSCRDLLEHLDLPIIALREMSRVSNKYVIITWFLPPSKKENLKKVNWLGGDVYYNQYSINYIESLLNKIGLRILEKINAGNNEIWILCKKNVKV